MTEHGQDQPDPGVEESLDSWGASAEPAPGWVPAAGGESRPPEPDAVATAVHVVESSESEPVAPDPVPVEAVPVAPVAVEPVRVHVEPAGVEPARVEPHGDAPQPVSAHQAAASPVTQGSSPVAAIAKLAGDRPELVIAGAFVGGLLLATLLKRLAR